MTFTPNPELDNAYLKSVYVEAILTALEAPVVAQFPPTLLQYTAELYAAPESPHLDSLRQAVLDHVNELLEDIWMVEPCEHEECVPYRAAIAEFDEEMGLS